MVKVRPFKAYLANKKNIKKIICPEYDTINTDEARVICGDNEMCFIHCNKPEIDLAKDINPYDDAVYIQGRNALQNFIKKGYLVQDEVATLYIY